LTDKTVGDDTDRPHDCFADEIAIDFPSVGDLVARVRDAWRGTVVPLEVPLRGTCEICGGRGESWTEPCADCGGTGECQLSHPVRLSVPAGVANGARLRFRVNRPHAAPLRVEVRVAIRSSAA
jgi:hypothetical protein